jgi:leader peptidase (prepilin peptidase)/N-methyltransferase
MIIYSLIAFFFGSIVGSFLNVLILRLPREQSIGGRSHCNSCKRQLETIDLIPIFSYILLRGKCRTCKARISLRYFIIEFITGGLFVLSYFLIEPTNFSALTILFRTWFILAVLIVVFVIDLEHMLILDKIVFPASLIVLGINLLVDILSGIKIFSLSSLTGGGFLMSILISGSFYLLWFISRGRWIGFGDVKFMLFLGLALAWPKALVSLFIAFVSGGVLGIILLASGKQKMQSKLPLGTFLSVGMAVALLWGKPILHWYLGFLGV